MPRAIPAPLRAKGLLPLGTLLKATRGRVTSFGIYALAAVGLLSGIYTLDSESGDGRYFVAPQPEHLYPVVTVSSHAALVCTCSS